MSGKGVNCERAGSENEPKDVTLSKAYRLLDNNLCPIDIHR